jgi:hypothetical protein
LWHKNNLPEADMRFWIAIIFAALLLPLSAFADRGVTVRPVSPLGSEITGNQWLFVIGIDSYIHWPRLKTAASDAKSLKDVLLARYHFDQEHLIELYDEQATRKNIIDRLRSLADRVSAEDSLVIYYAGHGHIDPITKEGSWIPVESELREVSAWISNHDIKNYLRVDAIKARHILLVSDSCFSGDFLRGTRGKLPDVTEEVIKKAYALSSRQAISSGGLEPVSDEGFGKNSVFSHFLVKTLRENQKPFLVPSDFFNNVRAGVAENAQQFPVFGTLRETGGQEGGELVLFLKTDDVLKILSTKTSEKKGEFERLKQLEASAQEAKRKEAEEVAKQEEELAALDSEIVGMKQRLGERAPRSNDSLDTMLAMVRQKEDQEKKLEQLRKQQEEEQRKRQEEIARLKREKDDQIIAILRPEVEKYKEITASKYGKDLQKEAWKQLVAKCPEGWVEGLKEEDIDLIIIAPANRKNHVTVREVEKTNVLGRNLLENPSAENGLTGWTVYPRTYTTKGSDPTAQDGKYYFFPGPNKGIAEAYQIINLSPAKSLIDQAQVRCKVSGFMRDNGGVDGKPDDTSQIVVEFLSGKNEIIHIIESPVVAERRHWVPFEREEIVPKGTEKVKYRLISVYKWGAQNNDGYFDNLYFGITQTR